MKVSQILLTPGGEKICDSLKSLLLPQGFNIREAVNPIQHLPSFTEDPPEVIILTASRSTAAEILQTVKEIRSHDPVFPLFMVTESSSEDQAVAMFRAGITDYFSIPFCPEELVASIKSNLPGGNKFVDDPVIDHKMIGNSRVMQTIKSCLGKIARTSVTVLISGETGTGKELVAELIHRMSPRRRKPFICINCAAVPEALLESELFGHERGAFTGAVTMKRGKFETVSGGSIFLDEISEMSNNAQAKLLRVIENRKTYRLGGNADIHLDFRVIAATNRNPEKMVQEGRFREDLYYRLNVAHLYLPPLRHRRDDIPLLVDHFIEQLNRKFHRDVAGITTGAMEYLLEYHWPGNIREMQNSLEAAFINLPERNVSFIDLPIRPAITKYEMRLPRSNEREHMISALLATNWNKSKAAEKLNWSRMTLYRKMQKYKISKSVFADDTLNFEDTHAE